MPIVSIIELSQTFLDTYKTIKNYFTENKEISIELNNGKIINYSDISKEDLKKLFTDNAINTINVKTSLETFSKSYDKLINKLEDIDSKNCNLILKTKQEQKTFKVYKNKNDSLVFLAGEEKTRMSISKEKLIDIAIHKSSDTQYKSYTSIIIEKLIDGTIFQLIDIAKKVKTQSTISKLAFICISKSDEIYLENNQVAIANQLKIFGWEIVTFTLRDLNQIKSLFETYKEYEIEELLFYYDGISFYNSQSNELIFNLSNNLLSYTELIKLISSIFRNKIAFILNINHIDTLNNIHFNYPYEFLFINKENQSNENNKNQNNYFLEALFHIDNEIKIQDIHNYISQKYKNQSRYILHEPSISIFIGNWNNNDLLKDTNSIGNPNEFKIKSKSEIRPVLGVETIADILSSIIVKQPNDSGMMIGIFGKWGRGKTYLAEQTWQKLKEKEPNYKRVIFSAWKYQDTKSSWAYLYENFIDEYFKNEYSLENEKKEWKVKVKNYLNNSKKLWKLNLKKHTIFPLVSFLLLFVLAIVWSFFVDKLWLIKLLVSSVGLVLLFKLFILYLQQKKSAIGLYQRYFTRKSYSNNLGFQSEVENELTNLLKTWIPEVNENEKIVLFVDDIDRCNIEQVISIIDGLRVILDNPEIHKRLIIITAIDEKILEKSLEHKYDDKNISTIYKEYLEKIFLIGLKLNPLNKHEVEDFFSNILPPKQLEENITSDINIKDNITSTKSDSFIEDNTYIGNDTYTGSRKIAENTPEESKIDKSNYEITNREREYLLEVIKKVKNITPRKIRIFYYKYLIMKQLFHIRLEEKGLVSNWKNESDEKIIADVLVYLANDEKIEEFESAKDEKVTIELKYVAEMVSVL